MPSSDSKLSGERGRFSFGDMDDRTDADDVRLLLYGYVLFPRRYQSAENIESICNAKITPRTLVGMVVVYGRVEVLLVEQLISVHPIKACIVICR